MITDYVFDIAFKYCGEVGEDPEGYIFYAGTNAIEKFEDRYNNVKLRKKFQAYKDDSDIQKCLYDLKLDPEMFWYLLVFVYDLIIDLYYTSKRASGKNCNEIVKDFGESLSNERKSMGNKSRTYLKYHYDEPVELTFKIGKKKVSITDGNAIGLIAHIIDLYETDYRFDHCALISSKYSESNIAYAFCEMMKYFFDQHITRSKTAKISNKEKELLSYLVYFTGFSKNKKLLEPFADDYMTIKNIMNKKNKSKLNPVRWGYY